MVTSDEILHLFYEEPDPDRWLPLDRYPRRLIRRLVRGPHRPGGVMRWFLNLRAGLDALGVPYVVNDYRSLRRSPGAVACVVGKPHVVDKIPPGHPIVYGPGIAAHPYESDFWESADIRLMLISCEWFKQMYDRDLPVKIPTAVWPAGVETGKWRPEAASVERRAGSMERSIRVKSGKVGKWLRQSEERLRGGAERRQCEAQSRANPKTKSPRDGKRFDFLIYDKVRWDHERYEGDLIEPIREELRRRGLSFREIRYGFYEEEDYRQALQECRAMIFLCEHETQGFAYLQALSCGVPILAWDRGGEWKDPSMYPERVRFDSVTAVPYWDQRCGEIFPEVGSFPAALTRFESRRQAGELHPRDYVVENFDLADRAREYVQLVKSVEAGATQS